MKKYPFVIIKKSKLKKSRLNSWISVLFIFPLALLYVTSEYSIFEISLPFNMNIKILAFAISLYFCSAERFRNDEVPPFGYVSALLIFDTFS